MGYLHRWNYKNKEPFHNELLNDVREIILDYSNVLENEFVSPEFIKFNGVTGKGCETFILHHENYYNSVKTGTFFVKEYDIVVTSILLTLIYHYPSTELNCDGLMTCSVNKETLGVNTYWENGIKFVRDKFGYEFDRELSSDEYEQEIILLKPRGVKIVDETN